MVSYSAEKNPPNPGKLTVENNTFESLGATAIGVKNFRDNAVILRNNSFKNVSTKYSGNHITEDNSSTVSIQTTTQTATQTTTANTGTTTSVNPATTSPAITSPVTTNSAAPSGTTTPTGAVPIASAATQNHATSILPQSEFIASSKIALLPENSDIEAYQSQIDAYVATKVTKYQLTPLKIRAIEKQLDKKIRKMEKKNLKKRLSTKENREYFLMLMYKHSLEAHRITSEGHFEIGR